MTIGLVVNCISSEILNFFKKVEAVDKNVQLWDNPQVLKTILGFSKNSRFGNIAEFTMEYLESVLGSMKKYVSTHAHT